MKLKSYQLLYKQAHLKRYFIFIGLFYVLMNLSRTLQALWFDENHQLGNFGLSYSAMALAGALSFSYAPLVARFSKKNPLFGPLLVYACGMSLRIFTNNPVIAACSGLLAGAGASSVLYALRSFLVAERAHDHFDIVLSHKSVIQQGASALGVALLGVTLATFSFTHNAYQYALLFCAFCMFLLFPIWNTKTMSETKTSDSPQGSWQTLIKLQRARTFVLIGFSTFTGLSVSCCAPFLIIALKNQGIHVSWIGLLMGVGIALSGVAQTLLTPLLSTKNKLRNFILTESLLAITTFALALSNVPLTLLVICYFIRLLVLSFSIFLQESLEYSLLPKEHASELLGFMQSAFLVGDMIGGSIGGYLAQNFGVNFTLKTSAILFISNGLSFVASLKIIEKKSQNGRSI